MTVGVVGFGGRRRFAQLNQSPIPWSFQVDLDVTYHFSGEPGWTQERRTAWKRAFARVVRQTWSHRWLLEPQVEHGRICQALVDRGYGPHARRAWGACDEGAVTTVILRVMDNSSRSAGLESLGLTVHPVHIFYDRTGVQTRFIDSFPTDSRLDEAFIFARDDVQVTPSGDDALQIGAAHEVGHALGLRHPGGSTAACRMARARARPGTEPLICYGEEGGARGSIMGTGMYVRQQDYQLFASMMNQMRTGFRWQVTRRRPWGRAQPMPGIDGRHAAAPGAVRGGQTNYRRRA